MANLKQKTRLSKLRHMMGAAGREKRFMELTGVSESWLKKASAGTIPITREKAELLEAKTGFSADWILEKQKSFAKGYTKKEVDRMVQAFKRIMYKCHGIRPAPKPRKHRPTRSEIVARLQKFTDAYNSRHTESEP